MRKLFFLLVIAAPSVSVSALAGEPLIPPEIVGMKIIGAMGVYYNGSASALLLNGNYLYCAMTFNGGLKTLDVSDPTNMVLTSEWDDGGGGGGQAYGLAIKETTLYLANWSNGLRVFNITDPAHPSLINTLSTTTITWHLCAEGHLLFIAVSNGWNVHGVDIFDITNPSSPTWRSFVSSDNEQVGRPTACGNYMYMFSGCWLSVYNVSNPSSPTFVRQLYSNAGVGDLAIRGGYLYLRGNRNTGTDGGLYVFSLTDPSSPQQVEFFQHDFGQDWPHGSDLHLQEGYAIMPAMGGGVYGFDINDPLNVTLLWQVFPDWPGTGHGGYPEGAAGACGYVFIGATSGANCTTQCGARVYALHVQDTMPPGPVTNFTATAGEGQVTLSWTNPSDVDFTGTMIRYSTTGCPATASEGTLVVDKANAPGTSDSYVHAGLTNGVRYYYSAFAHNSSCKSVKATANALPQDIIPPGPVTGFTATAGESQISLAWTNPSTADFTATMIRYKTTGYPASPTDGTLVVNKANTPGSNDSYVHSGLTYGVTYYYAAFAHDLSNNYSSAVTAHASPLDTTPPGPVTAFEATGANCKVTLSWINPTTADFTATRIRYKTTGFPTSPTDGISLANLAGAPGSHAQYVHNGLTNGITYYYAAFAHDSVPNYAAAAHASGKPFLPGDFDLDGDVDQQDFGHFQVCLSGFGTPYAAGCADADLEGDNDVDTNDLSVFLDCMAGANQPPRC